RNRFPDQSDRRDDGVDRLKVRSLIVVKILRQLNGGITARYLLLDEILPVIGELRSPLKNIQGRCHAVALEVHVQAKLLLRRLYRANANLQDRLAEQKIVKPFRRLQQHIIGGGMILPLGSTIIVSGL